MPNIQLFDASGNRKYLTPAERKRFEEAALKADGVTGSFALMLLHSGCRISEALNVNVHHIDYDTGCVTFETLKQRQKGVFRQVPLPDSYLTMLNHVFDLRRRQTKAKEKNLPLWSHLWQGKVRSWSRKTAYSHIVQIMKMAKIEGVGANPKGLRHGFAIACIDKAIPLNMVQKWMGHSSITTTAIYANATGEEERKIAARIWL